MDLYRFLRFTALGGRVFDKGKDLDEEGELEEEFDADRDRTAGFDLGTELKVEVESRRSRKASRMSVSSKL